ncbi:MAG: hypothetical protein U0736_15925 [Gemmataceae bacterium]
MGILQLDGGRRSPRHELLPGRADANVAVQDGFRWDEILLPVFVDEFAELEERLAAFPPPLRPRRLAEDFHVLRAWPECGRARFDAATHTVQALVVTGRGGRRCWSTRGPRAAGPAPRRCWRG